MRRCIKYVLRFFKFVRLSYCSVFFCCCTVDVLHVQLLAGTTFKSKNGESQCALLFPTIQKKVASALYFYTVSEFWCCFFWARLRSPQCSCCLCSLDVRCPDSESAVCTVFTQLCCSVKLNCCVYFYISVYSSVGDGTHSLCLRLYTLGAETRW